MTQAEFTEQRDEGREKSPRRALEDMEGLRMRTARSQEGVFGRRGASMS